MRLHAIARVENIEQRLIGRVARTPLAGARADSFVFVDDDSSTDYSGYLGILAIGNGPRVTGAPIARGLHHLAFLDDGDVVSADPGGFVRVLYRRNSPHNFILATEQCNSLCLMCSQPPKAVDDSHRLAEHLRLIDLIDPSTREIGITGGEPTLLRDGFIQLVARCGDRLPQTALHVLTNGRLFFYRSFAAKLGAIRHPDLVLGIPLYSDIDSLHDHIVQSHGAFEETVIGLHHLDRHEVRVEIRIVLHALSLPRLPQLATFIARNFPFAYQVALMGLEMTGLVHKHLGELWIDPAEVQPQLREVTDILSNAGVPVSIYNHQLCVLDPSLWSFARKSISDWKNVYLPECAGCAVLDRCGGFFQSGTRLRSAHIHAIGATEGRIA